MPTQHPVPDMCINCCILQSVRFVVLKISVSFVILLLITMHGWYLIDSSSVYNNKVRTCPKFER